MNTIVQYPDAVVRPAFSLRRCVSAIAWGLALATSAQGGQTDLSSLPLITSAPQVVKPNLMFILDDSGSMAMTHMPDAAANFGRDNSGNAKYGYPSAQCNGVYYNPALLYSPPVAVAANGAITNYPDASFTGAWINGYNTGAGTVDLSTSFRAWTKATTNNGGGQVDNTDAAAVAAFYYTYSGSQLSAAQKDYLNTSSTFYTECATLVSAGSSVFTKVTVSSTSGTGPAGADERTNFANWYSYYRTRMLMMKTATGLAFKSIDDRYRIGYMSLNNNVSPSFLNLSAFDGTQKNAWYAKLYGASPNNSTPLREALANAGRMYAGKITTLNGATVNDPIQYSCQKNFTLLSTDGYWNGNAGFEADGSTDVGNQDAAYPRPFNDGGTASNVYTATIVFSSGASSDNVSSIKVNGVEILSGTADSSGGFGSRAEKLARNVTNKVNACTSSTTGNCGVAGYSAVRDDDTVTITAPTSAGAISFTPSVTVGGGASATIQAFSGSSVASGGTSDTLADVAMYYYKTDLRSQALNNETNSAGDNVAQNNVQPGGDDDATHQHMTTFTLGLGARGRMIYTSNYKSATSGDYHSVKTGATASSSVCTWQTAGTTCNWPTPGNDKPENIDDLWHAAVNGRGRYFSSTDPASLGVGLLSALQSVAAMTSDSASATTSNPNVTAGDNYVFSSTFRSAEWYGELERRQLDVVTGQLAAAADWTAGAQLDAKTTRTIYTFDAGAATKLKSFEWANLTAAEQAYFTKTYMASTASPPLSQFCASGSMCLSAASQTAAGGAPLVNFLRGDRSNEGSADDTSKYFRQRARRLGDIVNSEAVYVRGPIYDYVDTDYATFKSTNAGRTPLVYVGANDGMLHAFNAATGDEVWAYVPKLLMPTLYRLADKLYPTSHQYYVDGSPTVGDVYFGGAWHTILVGGFNGGGRGYYALDITNPSSPKALWEFNDTNMGYSFGRPEITKLANGTWVVLFTSGYNNVNPGNGQGYLYVVNAGTGAAINSISTGVGSDTGTITGICETAPCPSGLAQIRAWVDNTRYNNTTTKVYGGDLYGNLWRFDVNDTFGAAGVEAQLLATMRGPGGAVQSMTARPELGKVAGSAVVFVGTGRYLGGTDLNNTDVQTIYGVKDNGGSSSVGNPRGDVGATGFVQQTLTAGTCPTGSAYCVAGTPIRTSSANPVNFATQKGWFVDLPGARERANTDPQLALGTLAVTTNLLDPSACSVGGSSYVNFFDYKTGGAVQGSNGMVGLFLGNALATRPVQLRYTDGTVRSLVRMSDNTWQTPTAPIPPSGIGTRRTSWREIVVE
ncbi:MAG TPA: PilC/PilY family type IV pilus protein [Burkholderiaceae bacterium]